MRRTIGFLGLLVVAFSSVASAQQSDSTARMVDRVFDNFRNTDAPGCAVGVSRNGRPVYERGYGMSNLETATPIKPSSIFHVASVSKQFTAAAIMLLEGDGKLSIDDDVRKYIPELPQYGTKITIRHLLTHTSGLRDQWDLLILARGRFEENRITEADVMDIVTRQTALNFTPGAEYLYSNTGFTLAGVIVRRVSGKSLREFADERIFRPLGMTSTHFHDDYTMLVPGRTSAYAPVNTAARWRVSIPNYDTYGATSLFTTVGDMLKWTDNLSRGTVLKPDMVARMESRTPLTNGDTSNYGFGLINARYRGTRVVEHNGADAGYRSYLGRYPEHELSIAIACNSATANPQAFSRAVADAFIGASLAPVAAPVTQQGVAMAPERLQARVGVYLQPTTRAVVRLGMRDGRLAVIAPGGPVLTPLDDNRFALANQPGDIIFADGDRASYDRRIPGQQPIRWERQQEVTPTPALLAQFAGEYVSAELGGAIYRVTATDSTLLLRTGTEEPLVSRLVFVDAFLNNSYMIQFIRSGKTVTGFEVTNGRMRRVKFTRKP